MAGSAERGRREGRWQWRLEVQRDGDVMVATWRDGENRLNLDSIGALESLASEVESFEGPCALVLAGEGKFFSNGLDLERFAGDAEQFAATVGRFHQLLGRLFVLPAYTVAAVNGHAFAGGAMLTCAFDHRVMREDRGYWCLNEAELGLPLTEQMAAAVLGRLPRAAAMEAMLTARRYAGPEARRRGHRRRARHRGRAGRRRRRACRGRRGEAPSRRDGAQAPRLLRHRARVRMGGLSVSIHRVARPAAAGWGAVRASSRSDA